MTPKRIQLKRTKGWRKPENCVVVARPTKFGNPFTVAAAIEAGHKPENAAAESVHAFREWLLGNPDYQPGALNQHHKTRDRILTELDGLRGKDLACWCPLDGPCHADILLRLANQ